MKTFIHRWIVPVICACVLVLNARAAAPTVIYSTGFESSEGFNLNADLAGQNGWEGFGSDAQAWNGLIDGLFAGYGQQAYIGYDAPPEVEAVVLSVWKGNLPTVPANQPLVKFTTLMAIMDSTTEHYDDFRWTVYNQDVERLFTLDFDNHALEINYALDNNAGYISTGKTFEPNRIYELTIVMDAARNRWSAWLDDVALVVEQPMTTQGSSLALGDVDAVWSIRDELYPGDNYMAFDDYSLVAYSNAIPPTLENVARQPDGSNLLRLTGEANRQYVIEVSTNLQTWTPVKTNTPPDGIFEYLDKGAAGQARRFYRARTD
ncbi:MAG TPA: hypothetical protein VGH19_22290 [Verrucomicrobiae bacterium]